MIRRFVINRDNAPLSINVIKDIVESAGTFFVETGTPVSWAFISLSSTINTSISSLEGIYNVIPNEDQSLEYDLDTITGTTSFEYKESSLQIYLNGIMLRKGIDYEESLDSKTFTLIVGDDAIPSLLNYETDMLQVLFVQKATFETAGLDGVIRIKNIYPEIPTGILLEYNNVDSSSIVLQILYR